MGTAEFYRALDDVDGIDDSLVVHLEDPTGEGPGSLVLFVVPAPTRTLDEKLISSIRTRLRLELSPRHVPDEIHAIAHVPTTLSGKKLELPVKRILLGADVDAVASPGSLAHPDSLSDVAAIAARRRAS